MNNFGLSRSNLGRSIIDTFGTHRQDSRSHIFSQLGIMFHNCFRNCFNGVSFVYYMASASVFLPLENNVGYQFPVRAQIYSESLMHGAKPILGGLNDDTHPKIPRTHVLNSEPKQERWRKVICIHLDASPRQTSKISLPTPVRHQKHP